MKVKCLAQVFCIIMSIACLAFCQSPHFVVNTNSYDATAYNNGHKIAVIVAMGGDQTIHLVYRSADTVFTIKSTDYGASWQDKTLIDNGNCGCPAIDLDRFNNRYVVWQKYVSGNNEIFYDCLDDYAPPINVSNSSGNSILPDLIVDTNLAVNITWTERVNGLNKHHIYYRQYYGGSLGDTIRLSNTGDNNSSSISFFSPNHRLYAAWWCLDSVPAVHHHIYTRYKDTSWSSPDSLATNTRALRFPSLDYSHDNDVFSAGWEDSTSGNLNARFYGGNGGGGGTAGRSRFPVLSTVGGTWSYLFWQEDSADIFFQTYYVMTGWKAISSLRTTYNITEPVRYPSCCGASLVWTQGNGAPYSIYFNNFGYPIGINEKESTLSSSNDFSLRVSQNPSKGSIRLITPFSQSSKILKIYDALGNTIKEETLPGSRTEHLVSFEGGSAGIYFLKCETGDEAAVQKIAITK